MLITKKVGAQLVEPAPLSRYGWPLKRYAHPEGVVWDVESIPALRAAGLVGDEKAVRWTCGSRRHAGDCADLAGRILFTRIRDGLGRLDKEELLMMVLTLKHREWETVEEAYLGIHPLWRKLMKQITRLWGDLVPVIDKKTGLQAIGRPRIVGRRMLLDANGKPLVNKRGRYAGFVKTEPIVERQPRWKRKRPRTITVVEKHPRSGFPHLNVIMECKQLALELGPHEVIERETPNGRVEKIRVPTTPLGKRTLRELKAVAVKCGFGWALSASPVDSVEAVAGYMVKTAKAGGTSTENSEGNIPGELAKPSQVADNAPMFFRAVRSTPGMMPPVRTDSEFLAEMRFRPLDSVVPTDARPETWVDRAVKPKRSSFAARASLARALQLDLLWWAANQEPQQLQLELRAA